MTYPCPLLVLNLSVRHVAIIIIIIIIIVIIIIFFFFIIISVIIIIVIAVEFVAALFAAAAAVVVVVVVVVFVVVTASFTLWLRRPPSERQIRGSNPACAGIFQGRVMPVTSKLALQWLPCQAPGVIGSEPGLVGPVSVYCDWVRWKVLICNFCLSVAARTII